jgi:hypothetical protein
VLVGLALSLAIVLVAPAAPASAYVQPYGRYWVAVDATNQCMMAPRNAAAGELVVRSGCYDQSGHRTLWHFDRVDTYWGDPVFEIRAAWSGGVYDTCLDVPYGDVDAGAALWVWPCNGGNAQRWRQQAVGTTNEFGEPLYRYSSMSAPDSGWVIQFNNGDAAPHLVMVQANWSLHQMFSQRYFAP